MINVDIADYLSWKKRYKLVMLISASLIYLVFIGVVFVLPCYRQLRLLNHTVIQLIQARKINLRQLKQLPLFAQEVRRLKRLNDQFQVHGSVSTYSERIIRIARIHHVDVKAIHHAEELMREGLHVSSIDIELSGSYFALLQFIRELLYEKNISSIETVAMECKEKSCEMSVNMNVLSGEST